MGDRELLEKAAKAAGIELVWPIFRPGATEVPMLASSLSRTGPTWWNPLTDDGDALRLAVKLSLTVAASGLHHHTRVWNTDSSDGDWDDTLHCGDPSAATRRAIVRAAAALEEPHHAG